MSGLPSGTVTFLFTDIEASTARWEHQPAAMGVALARHDALLRAAIHEHGGYVVKTMGDAFHAAFSRALDGVMAALDAQHRLQAEPWDEIAPEIGGLRVRMALHTGAAEERDGDYYGPALNRAARLLSAGHGGQVLLSLATAELIRDALPEDTTPLDLGEHRLKDLIRPERVFQVSAPGLPTEFPPLRTLDARPHNLPVQTSTLLGREDEIARVRERLLHDDVRLLTLTGPGGTGKTRLSLQVAAEVIDRFADGVYFVALAPISDPDLVPPTIAQTLGVRTDGNRPIVEVLKAHLSSKHLLLLLDNFEQILPAAPVVVELLGAAAGLKILVTSRAALQVRGEYEYAVPPLALPDRRAATEPATLSQYGAVALFVERASAIKPDFAVTNENAPAVAEICHRLDGLPLAIELAAARIRLLTPQAILARLERRLPLLTGGARDLPARQQTLRNAIAWSYDLLTPEEQALYRRLSVFVGGCTLEAAQAVCDPDGALGLDVLDGITSLAAQSLVRQTEAQDGEPRFTMLETIREFGLEQVQASGEETELRCRHAEHFLALAERAELGIRGQDDRVWLQTLELEHDNVRAALGWWQTDVNQPDAGLRMVGAVYPFWWAHGHLVEGVQQATTMLDAHLNASAAARAKAILRTGYLLQNLGSWDDATACFRQSLELYRDLGDTQNVADSLRGLGLAAANGPNTQDRAMALFQESLDLCRATGEGHGAAWSLLFMGTLARNRGDLTRAGVFLREALQAWRGIGRNMAISLTVVNLARWAHALGNDAEATNFADEAFALSREVGDRIVSVAALSTLAWIALDGGDEVRATACLAESLRLGPAVTPTVATVAEPLEGLAAVAVSRGQTIRAATLLGAAEAARESSHTTLPGADRPRLARIANIARSAVGTSAFDAARAEGQAMTLEQAVAYALVEPASS